MLELQQQQAQLHWENAIEEIGGVSQIGNQPAVMDRHATRWAHAMYALLLDVMKAELRACESVWQLARHTCSTPSVAPCPMPCMQMTATLVLI